VFFDNDTRLLFATAFDGDWDTYIDDFVAKIPDYLDIIDSAWDGWPGIRSPRAKDYLAKHQITAEGWYVGSDSGGDQAAPAHRQGGGRIPRQGRLKSIATRMTQERTAMATLEKTRTGPDRVAEKSRRYRSFMRTRRRSAVSR
jgi:hypothetical protein